jgi:hypothetical protein
MAIKVLSATWRQQIVQLAPGQLADKLVANRPATEQQDSGHRHDAKAGSEFGRFARTGYRNRCETTAARCRVRQQRQESLAGRTTGDAKRQQYRHFRLNNALGKRMVRDFDHGVGVLTCEDD